MNNIYGKGEKETFITVLSYEILGICSLCVMFMNFIAKYSEKKAMYLHIIIRATVTDKIFNISSYTFSIIFLFDRFMESLNK